MPRLGSGVAFAQIGIIGFGGQIEFEALRLYGLPAILYGCPSLPAGARTLALETSWDLQSLGPGATANFDVTVPARDGVTSRTRHSTPAASPSWSTAMSGRITACV